MGIEVNWDNEAKTIIRYIYDGRWTWEELDLARDAAAKLEAAVDYRVNVIVDVQNSKLLPNGTISRARQVASTNARLPTRMKASWSSWELAPSCAPSMMSFRKSIQILFSRRGFFLARSLEEAHAIIEREIASTDLYAIVAGSIISVSFPLLQLHL